ncbi:MAG TPA: S9 family peptidase, partial [Edaphobacter sp.]
MTPARICLAAALTLLPLLAPAQSPATHSDPRIGNILDTLGKTRTPSFSDISPDGKTVAWSVRGSKDYELHLTEISNPSKDISLRPTSDAADCGSDAPSWSPDGETLAYASTCTPEHNGQAQIFLWSKKSGQSRQLTHVTGTIDDLAWSPDGRQIAFLFVENATRSAGALAAMKPWNGVYGEDGVEVQRVYGVDLATGAGNWLTPQNLHVYEFSWAPSSHQIAFVAANPP